MPRASSRSSSSDSTAHADLVDGALRLLVMREPAFEQRELQRHRHQPLLGTVVQVPLEALPLRLRRLDHPAPRRAQIVEAGVQLDGQSAVLEGDGRRGGDRGEQLGLVVQRRIVDQGRDVHPRTVDRRRHTPGVRLGQLDLPAVRVDVGAELGQPVDELERRIADRPGERLPELQRARVVPESYDEVGDRDPRQTRPRRPPRNAMGTMARATSVMFSCVCDLVPLIRSTASMPASESIAAPPTSTGTSTAERWARLPPTPADDSAQRGGTEHEGAALGLVDPVLGTVVRPEAEIVGEPRLLEDEEPCRLQDQVGGDGDDHQLLEPALDPPALREDE